MFNIYVWFMIISTLISIFLLLYAVATHYSERSFFLILSTICTFLYSFGYLLEMISPTLEAAFMGVRVQKMGSPFLVLLNYLFIRDVYGEKRFGIRGYCLLFALPVFNLFTAQAFPFVRLHYTHIEYFWNGMIANCQGYLGPVGALAIAYHFFLVALMLLCILRHMKREGKLQKRQSLNLLIAILVPLTVNIYHTLSYNHLRIDLNPFAVAVGQILILYSVRYQNLLNVVPLARARVIETMADAFIVCDRNFGFLDANMVAKQLFPELNTLPHGEPMKQADQLKNSDELCLEMKDGPRFYKITKTDIQRSSKNSGICIILHDITDKENQLKKLYDKATIDSLTHIYTRAAFSDFANHMLKSDKAKVSSYALLMMDLDNFKMVNDTYGHPCGDAVLKKITAIMKDYFHGNDIVGRYGGEEISVLLEGISINGILAVVENLRSTIEGTVILYQGHELNITVSIGMAYYPAGEAPSLEEMFVQADMALYRAKNGGRNRICLYGE